MTAGYPPIGSPAGPMPEGRFTGTPWRARVVSFGLVAADFIASQAAAVLGLLVYQAEIFRGIRMRNVVEPGDFLLMGLGMGMLLLVTFSALGLYSRGTSILNVEEDMRLIQGFIFTAAAVLGLSYLLRDADIPRIALLLALAILVPLVIMGRRLLRRIAGWFMEAGLGSQPVAICGTGNMARELATRIMNNPQMGLRPVGFFFDEEAETEVPEGELRFGPGQAFRLPILGGLQQLETLPPREVRLLFIAIPTITPERLVYVQDICRNLGIASHYVPLFSNTHFRRMNLTFIGDIPLLSERAMKTPLLYGLSKRAFDLAVALLLLILLSPLFLLITALIRLTSRGPVIFSQDRVGQYGLIFRIYKFRTMHVETHPYSNKPESGADPRIFAIGRILRKLSLDEFPQLVNVLRGEMSLVGPRPDMPQIVAEYTPLQRERLLVPPGMTGLWQVSADRKFPIHENLDYDLYYIYNRSFLLDLAILIRTAFCMTGGH